MVFAISKEIRRRFLSVQILRISAALASPSVSCFFKRNGESEKNVKKVTVNITPANDSVFADEKTVAKASILIVPASPFEKFKDESIKSMMVLAASELKDLQ